MSILAALAAAIWLGLSTSISPRPLATNIAATSFLARRLESQRRGVLGVLAYAVGRAAAYAVIGVIVVWDLAAAPATSMLLQRFLQPFNFGPAKPGSVEGLTRYDLAGAFLLGVLFAVTFCPISAALFFGSLLTLAVSSPAQWPLFFAYGPATAVPVACR